MASVTFKGNPVNLLGNNVEVGAAAPSVTLKAGDLSDITIGGANNKAQIILTMPSLDTPVCATQARDFNKKIASYPNAEAVIVTLDLPFAMGRFCSTEGITNLKVASDFIAKEFGEKYGVLIGDGALKGLLARAIFVIKDGKIAYKDIVSEITELPNLEPLDTLFSGGCGCSR
ncbi:thiol peroxidase [uncultured Helicobacter sp.]|uniref:thiol peroxidase n=1 Tax=uncultured Helicobacter sp. TaxID=175537 RepID=UPI0025E28AFB|nr:thiol peroxidase [uncultured Helicobacter sp.]